MRVLNFFLLSLTSITLVIVLTLSSGLLDVASIAKEGHRHKAPKFNKKGELVKPEGYREWVFVGAPVTPNSLNNGKAAFPEFHNVYIDPGSFEHYSKTGEFRDGTILIKELVSVGATKASSGNGFFEGDFEGLEATVKDSKRFAKEPGNWAYFSFSTADHTLPYKDVATAFPAEACNSCHQANAADDWVFTQYYPVLRAAKAEMKMKK